MTDVVRQDSTAPALAKTVADLTAALAAELRGEVEKAAAEPDPEEA